MKTRIILALLFISSLSWAQDYTSTLPNGLSVDSSLTAFKRDAAAKKISIRTANDTVATDFISARLKRGGIFFPTQAAPYVMYADTQTFNNSLDNVCFWGYNIDPSSVSGTSKFIATEAQFKFGIESMYNWQTSPVRHAQEFNFDFQPPNSTSQLRQLAWFYEDTTALSSWQFWSGANVSTLNLVDGKVAIGHNAPGSLLHIAGTSTVSPFELSPTMSTTGSVVGIRQHPTITSTNSSPFSMYDYSDLTAAWGSDIYGWYISLTAARAAAGGGNPATIHNMYIVEPGTVTNTIQYQIGLHIGDMTKGATTNRAIVTGLGAVDFGDMMTLRPHTGTPAAPSSGFTVWVTAGGANPDTLRSIDHNSNIKQLAP
jgi:hypothetical protein